MSQMPLSNDISIVTTALKIILKRSSRSTKTGLSGSMAFIALMSGRLFTGTCSAESCTTGLLAYDARIAVTKRRHKT